MKRRVYCPKCNKYSTIRIKNAPRFTQDEIDWMKQVMADPDLIKGDEYSVECIIKEMEKNVQG